MNKWLFVLTALFVTGCSSADKAHQLEAKVTQNYNSVLGIDENQVTSMYVGYHIGPGGSWEFTTSNREKIKFALDFLKEQNFKEIGTPTDTPTSGDSSYDRLEFITPSKHVDVDFVSQQEGEVIRINDALYRISSTLEDEKNLFFQLKTKK